MAAVATVLISILNMVANPKCPQSRQRSCYHRIGWTSVVYLVELVQQLTRVNARNARIGTYRYLEPFMINAKKIVETGIRL